MKIDYQLFDVLQSIEGNGTFVTSGESNMIFPGLFIDGFGEVALPLNASQAKDLIKLATQAPFGKGSETITDTEVRRTWEIEASLMSFKNPDWDKKQQQILTLVKSGLGLEQKDVSCELYKLLIYEEGGFFLPHKDSEKTQGMFGTMVIGLPAAHTGGELWVRFGEQEEKIDFSSAQHNYMLPFTAFYADCEHEIKPITSGYRVCLVYNLIQEGEANISLATFSDQTKEMASLLKDWKKTETTFPKAILLGHDYTPANFSLPHLKLHDLPRADALLAAAEGAGFMAQLGLVTHYLMGDLEGGYDDWGYGGRRRYGHNRSYEPEEESMGSVHEESTYIEHWATDGSPHLGRLSLKENNILTDIELGEGDPTEQESEGFTGNAGMTMEFWYHYGAVILWPKERHIDILKTKPLGVRLSWLQYYRQVWNDVDTNAEESTRHILKELVDHDFSKNKYETIDYDTIAESLLILDDEAFMIEAVSGFLPRIFAKINTNLWRELWKVYGANIFEELCYQVGTSGKNKKLEHLFLLLEMLIADEKTTLSKFMQQQLNFIPDYLEQAALHTYKNKSSRYNWEQEEKKPGNNIQTRILLLLLDFSTWKKKDKAWLEACQKQLFKSKKRDYLNDVLVSALQKHKEGKSPLFDGIHDFCCEVLRKKTAKKPQPLPDWKREVPKKTSTYSKNIWEMLRPFLLSPTEKVFDYVANQSERNIVSNALSSVEIDLTTTTIQKGRPYTLRITKTQAAYERKLKAWKEDVAYLQELEAIVK